MPRKYSKMIQQAMGMASGTTADRPTDPEVGMQFVNGSLGITEVYTENDGWQPLTSSSTGIAYGTTANRPTPELGIPYFNADESRLELYTSTVGWSNIVQETPGVIGVTGRYIEGNPSTTLVINGNNFASGATAFVVGTDGSEIIADSTSVNSVVEISATFSGLSKNNEPYDVKVVNPSNLYGVAFDTLQVDDIPVFITQSGTLGTYTEDSPISIQISATDDESEELTYSVSSGSLPDGLSLNSSTGEISGTPTSILATTSYSFVVSVTDGSNTATRNFSMTITDRGPSWQTEQIIPEKFIKDTPYTKTLSAIDDDLEPVIYSIISGSLPDGLSLNQSTGEISGTPTSAVTTIFTARAYTSAGEYSDRQFTLKNIEPVWETLAGLIPDYMEKDVAYSYQLQVTEDDTATYSVISGSLPIGLSLNASTGEISGTPTSSDDATFTVRVEDSNGEFVDREFTLHVGPKFSTPAGQITSAVTQLEATYDSATTPAYSITAGALPTGITMSSSGVFSGTPDVGTYNFTVTLADSLGITTSREFSIVATDNPITATFEYTGSQQTYTVPDVPGQIQFDVYGAASGRSGNGGRATGYLNNISAGQTLYIYVGGQGAEGANASGGYNGGGAAGGNRGNEASGGGATDIRYGGTSLNDRIVVAGGGGGAGGYAGAAGGGGGGSTGDNGGSGQGGGGEGGSQSAGGNPGSSNGGSAASAGSFGQGGTGGTSWNAGGGGGGGGWYGGGGGGADDDSCCSDAGGGGGGSGHLHSTYTISGTFTNGVRSGNGLATLSYLERQW